MVPGSVRRRRARQNLRLSLRTSAPGCDWEPQVSQALNDPGLGLGPGLALASSLCETLASPIYRTLNSGGLVCPPGFEAELGFEPGCVRYSMN